MRNLYGALLASSARSTTPPDTAEDEDELACAARPSVLPLLLALVPALPLAPLVPPLMPFPPTVDDAILLPAVAFSISLISLGRIPHGPRSEFSSACQWCRADEGHTMRTGQSA